MKLSELKALIREEVTRGLNEKWGGEAKVKKLNKYGKGEESMEDLKSKQSALRSKKERTPEESKELKRINFAIRARSGWGKA